VPEARFAVVPEARFGASALLAALTVSFSRSLRNFVTEAITRSPARFEAT
jgi:hypothetical protein